MLTIYLLSSYYWCLFFTLLYTVAHFSLFYLCSLLSLIQVLTSLSSTIVYTSLSSTGVHFSLLQVLSSIGDHFSVFLLVLTTIPSTGADGSLRLVPHFSLSYRCSLLSLLLVLTSLFLPLLTSLSSTVAHFSLFFLVLTSLSSTVAHFSSFYKWTLLSLLLVLTAFFYCCSLLFLLRVITALSSTGAHCILLLLLTSLPSILLVFATLSSTGAHFSLFLVMLTTLPTIYAHDFFPIYAYYCSRVASYFSLFWLVFLFISDHIDASTFDKQPVFHLLLFNAGLLYFPREVLPEEQWQKRRGWVLTSPQGMRIYAS